MKVPVVGSVNVNRLTRLKGKTTNLALIAPGLSLKQAREIGLMEHLPFIPTIVRERKSFAMCRPLTAAEQDVIDKSGMPAGARDTFTIADASGKRNPKYEVQAVCVKWEDVLPVSQWVPEYIPKRTDSDPSSVIYLETAGKRYLTRKETMQRLGVGEGTLCRYVRLGYLTDYRWHNVKLIDSEELKHFTPPPMGRHKSTHTKRED